ncbi:hypothetical protein CULT_1240022 [[Clostridium] ultunense Esp]|uniref:Uncharacterized protein n=1 Tax=[Clostridium] ultunense Esp TaxID=1288971 RepID=M1Z613_9FIRM|nr:hypothetical protein [Schnuerera ultunensis]CCQ93179.1 hypothetical protein CULT_1240022 [[Clostridium] ultunense Esp]SHD78459.1 conserved protein of unknown function [[Clostridium] ultunense Esp]
MSYPKDCGNAVFIDESNFAFCDIFKFNEFGKNAKVKEVSSYVIRLSK